MYLDIDTLSGGAAEYRWDADLKSGILCSDMSSSLRVFLACVINEVLLIFFP